MRIEWTSKALGDLARLYEFLALLNQSAAARLVQNLTKAPNSLVNNPCMGEKLDEFLPQEVRRVLVGQYEIRYAINGEIIYILRVWHTREER